MKKFICFLICLFMMITFAHAEDTVNKQDSSPIPVFCLAGWLKYDACKDISTIAEYYEDKYVSNSWPYKYYILKDTNLIAEYYEDKYVSNSWPYKYYVLNK